MRSATVPCAAGAAGNREGQVVTRCSGARRPAADGGAAGPRAGPARSGLPRARPAAPKAGRARPQPAPFRSELRHGGPFDWACRSSTGGQRRCAALLPTVSLLRRPLALQAPHLLLKVPLLRVLGKGPQRVPRPKASGLGDVLQVVAAENRVRRYPPSPASTRGWRLSRVLRAGSSSSVMLYSSSRYRSLISCGALRPARHRCCTSGPTGWPGVLVPIDGGKVLGPAHKERIGCPSPCQRLMGSSLARSFWPAGYG